MTNPDYTAGRTEAELLAMMYCVPLAPFYRERIEHFIRPDGRVHGNLSGAIFLLTPTGLEAWRQAYAYNVAAFA